MATVAAKALWWPTSAPAVLPRSQLQSCRRGHFAACTMIYLAWARKYSLTALFLKAFVSHYLHAERKMKSSF